MLVAEWTTLLLELTILSNSFAQMPMKNFKPVPAPPPLFGTYMCATQQPNNTLDEDDMQTGMDRFSAASVPLQVQCSYQCTADPLCIAFNFIDYPVPICQLYHYTPTICGEILHCMHYTDVSLAASCLTDFQRMGFLVTVSAWGMDDSVNTAYITINNTLTSGFSRGINTVELNLVNGTLSNQQAFDTCGADSFSDAFANYVNGLQLGTVLIGTTYDDAESHLSTNARTALMSIGVDVTGLQFRGKFAFVAQIGQPQQTVWGLGPSGGNNVVIGAVVKDGTVCPFCSN